MRNLNVRIFLFLLAFFYLGCAPRPQKTTTPDQLSVPAQTLAAEDKQKALWFAGTNYSSGGNLGRLDLETGKLATGVLPIAPDTQIFQDGKNGLFLLTRMHQDALTLLSGDQAKVGAQFSLKERVNPQWAARDSQNRIWLTSLDSNFVQIFSSDLNSQVGSVDLSGLVEENSTDGFAELAQVIALGQNQMAVSAQRLHRGVGYWKPDPKSGLAIINTDTLRPEYMGLVEAPNPDFLFSPVTSFLLNEPSVYIFGAGDLSSSQGVPAKINLFSLNSQTSLSLGEIPYRIISSHITSLEQPPAMIAWYQADHKSCVQLGEKQIVCDGSGDNGGYVFNKILRYGNLLFVSYVAFRNAQLWIVPLDGTPIQKIDMGLPIESMSFGP